MLIPAGAGIQADAAAKVSPKKAKTAAAKAAAKNANRYDEGNSNAWEDIEYDDDPWVFNSSRPYFVTAGLQNRHLSLWASHGRYWDAERGWKWQRPNLFCTNEDLFTQTIVVPYLIPMLQNAGAIVFTPRERDWQQQEIIVDNNDRRSISYIEVDNSKKWKDCDSLGFANAKTLYSDGENPFTMGTVRQAKATKKKKKYSLVSYQPKFKEAGKYAVYVSYQTLPKSVPDAKYIVYHKGQATEFTVNQRMGGGTWVYLGTFDFDKGCNEFNRVVCTNQASKRGVVTTDAVRFGGGMGNIERGGDVSGLPRCLEGARYYAQWAGAPYKVYGGRQGKNDYADDINTRSLMTNWLGGGSVYMPALSGKKVPIELSLALHSDAGFNPDGKSTWGALAICTTDFNDGMLNSGVSRFTSKDFAKALRDNLVEDMSQTFGAFGKRYLWDRNYSETRLPEVPSAILEMLSHQSFPDMRIAQDPMGKFTIARSIYKTILRFVNSNHGEDYVVQPLAPNHFSVEIDEFGYAKLTWSPQLDKLEPSAKPTRYIVYKAEGNGGFDNGTLVRSPQHFVKLEPGKLYNFRVAAVNQGGESFPSEILSVGIASASTAKPVLVVNGFDRTGAPDDFRSNDDEQAGFLADDDNGVPYKQMISYVGKMKEFRRAIPWTDDDAAGYGDSYGNYEKLVIKGNTFDYPALHGQSILKAGYSFVSVSKAALADHAYMNADLYSAVDIILGKEKQSKMGRIGAVKGFDFKTFDQTMQQAITDYCKAGGRVFVSGSYVATDIFQNPLVKAEDADKKFAREILKYEWRDDKAACEGAIKTVASPLTEERADYSYYNKPNEESYVVESPDAIVPADPAAYTCFRYSENNLPAGVVFGGNETDKWRTVVLGFPFESIKGEAQRDKMMMQVLNYLIK